MLILFNIEASIEIGEFLGNSHKANENKLKMRIHEHFLGVKRENGSISFYLLLLYVNRPNISRLVEILELFKNGVEMGWKYCDLKTK